MTNVSGGNCEHQTATMVKLDKSIIKKLFSVITTYFLFHSAWPENLKAYGFLEKQDQGSRIKDHGSPDQGLRITRISSK